MLTRHRIMYHQPALLAESLQWLALRPDGVYVDATFGGGGHSRAILSELTAGGWLFAFDQDPDARQQLEAHFKGVKNLTLFPTNFRNIAAALTQATQAGKVDGILADLGVSSHQLDTPNRGFSYRFQARLDMRMDPLHQSFTAVDLLNTYPEPELARVLRDLGELPNAFRIAHAITKYRFHKSIETVADLDEALAPVTPRHDRYSWLSRLYQALRIEVNDEINVLKEFLQGATQMLAPGGRLVILSYHSLEDRLVKHYFRAGNFTGEVVRDLYGNPLTPLEPLTSKPIFATDSEQTANPRARSARLRAAQKRDPKATKK